MDANGSSAQFSNSVQKRPYMSEEDGEIIEILSMNDLSESVPDDMRRPSETSASISQDPSVSKMGLCHFGSVLLIFMTAGILVVCFTSPKRPEPQCPFTLMSQSEDLVREMNRKSPIALGDLNNDDRLDIIVTEHDNNKVTVFLGYGNGLFPERPMVSATLSSSPYFMTIGDFNNDHRLDLAVANHAVNNVGIFLGHGNGTFAEERMQSLGASRPLSLVAHDMNNDNKLDLIVINDGTSNLGFLRGYGDGTFASPVTLFTGFDSLPREAVVADFNNDNRMDIAVVNTGTNNFGVFLQNDEGRFSSQIISLTGSQPVSLAVGDFNKDSRIDVTVATSGENSIHVFLGNGDGTFAAKASYSTGVGSRPSSVAVRDFNQDDQADIVVTNPGTKELGLLIGHGDGAFGHQRIYPIEAGAPQVVLTSDLNNDSWIDVIVAIDSVYNVGIFLSSPDRTFTNLTTFSTGPQSVPCSIAVGDFNNDARLDLIVTNYMSFEVRAFMGQGNGNFESKSAYSTGPNSMPTSAAIGDLNSDGRLDIIVSNSGSDSLGISFGLGDGMFSNQTQFPTGLYSTPISVAVGDFNNDKHLDIVTANYYWDGISVFLGLGNGSIVYQNTYSTGSNSQPRSVAVDDLNKDSCLDIAVVSSRRGSLSIFLGAGDGTFSDGITYETGLYSGPIALAIGDFNLDSYLDIAVVNSISNTLGVFVGLGNGTFQTQVTYSTQAPSKPSSVVVGDLNDDTHVDLIVANFDSNTVGVFLGYGNGTFATQVSYPTGWDSWPYAVAVGDFNGDTRLDVAVALTYYFSLGIFLGYYNSLFTVPTLYSSGSLLTPFALAVGDFDNDNRLDVVATNRDEGNVAIYMDFMNGNFQSFTFTSTNYKTGLSSVAVGDFNDDEQSDIVVTNYADNNIIFFLGFGNGSFGSVVSYTTGLNSGPCSVAVGDFNNDSRLDLVSANIADNSMLLFLHYGLGAFENRKWFSAATDKPSRLLTIGNFNRDTHLDMLIVNYQSSNIAVLFGNGDGTFSNQTVYSIETGSFPISAAVGDFNGDTRLDIVVANRLGRNIQILLGSSDGTFVYQTTYPVGSKSFPSSVAVADLNHDARFDIVMMSENGYRIAVFYGYGNGRFSNFTTYSTANYTLTDSPEVYATPSQVTIGDFNNDGQLDIVTNNYVSFTISVFLGKGNDTFSNETDYPTGTDSWPIGTCTGDFNSDGRTDIAVANYGTHNIGIFLGNGDGTFADQVTYPTGHLSGPHSVAVGDFNKDGHLDIAVILTLVDNLAIHFGNGDGTFSEESATFETGTATYPWSLRVADFNADGWLDVGVLLGNGPGVLVFLGNRNRMFLVPTRYSTGANSAPRAVSIGDFNSDQHLDVAIAYSKSNGVGVFLGLGKGRLSNPTTYLTGAENQPWALALGDLDSDSRLDIVVANRDTSNIGVFLGFGDGTFRNITTYSTGWLSNPESIAILDVNRDNKSDIVVANSGANSISIFEGNGQGTFPDVISYLTGYKSRPAWIAVGDFNKDQWTDIVIATSGSKNIKVLLKSC